MPVVRQRAVRKRVPRTRSAGTMTEAQFWAFLRSLLRYGVMRKWRPIGVVKRKARRAYHGSNRKRKWEYQCKKCRKWFADKEVQVDHIVPAGKLTSFEDLSGFARRLFCEAEGLQVLCKQCHLRK